MEDRELNPLDLRKYFFSKRFEFWTNWIWKRL